MEKEQTAVERAQERVIKAQAAVLAKTTQHQTELEAAAAGEPADPRKTQRALDEARAEHKAQAEVLDAANAALERAKAVAADEEEKARLKRLESLAGRGIRIASGLDKLTADAGSMYQELIGVLADMAGLTSCDGLTRASTASVTRMEYHWRLFATAQGLPGGQHQTDKSKPVPPFASWVASVNAELVR
ncbi:MAG TPA: hypothetical protein VHB46_04460 [Burkholderiales bacterium]|nr:hypothetical protein [Burkholderiales bacterium]